MWEVPKPPIMLVADLRAAGDRLMDVVEESLRAGCRWVLVRGKAFPTNILMDVTSKILRLSEPWRARVFVSGHPEIVAEVGAHGVHLPWGGDFLSCRRMVGDDVAVGMSTHSLDEALEAERLGVDYITLSPIYPSISKPNYSRCVGLDGLRRVAESVRIPVIALGGIASRRAVSCLAMGARGVAVLGAVTYAGNPFDEMAELIREVSVY